MSSEGNKPAANKPAKKPKAKGPIRWEAVVPTAVIVALVGAYFSFFFDGHVRRAMEYVGTQIHGAEVNIGSLSTSFLGASLEIRDIQVTDKNKPQRNIVQIGAIKFGLLWDALLRAKVVVNDASILNIQALSPRKSPGYVVPPTPADKGPTLLDKAQDQVLAQTRKKLNDNFLGDVASILGGVDPKEQLKSIQGQLKSDARIKEIEKEFKEKKAKWEARIKELPQAQDLKEYEARIKALKFDTKNPAEFAANLKEADKILKEADKKVKLVEQTSKDVKGEVNTYTQAIKDIEKMIDEDLRDLQTRLKLPNVDSKEFTQQLFMQMIESKIVGVRKYVEVARKYMPPKRSEAEKQARKEEQLVPPRRGEGKTYRFPITTGYPLFWLKHAAISSEVSSSEYSGNIKGEIKDATTDPAFIKKPLLITVQGDFPKQNIQGLDAKITIDHTTDRAQETMVMSIASFPLGETKLSNSPDVKLAIGKARGSTVMNAAMVDQSITVDIRNSFQEVDYQLEAKNKMVHEIIDAVLKGIPTVTLNAGIKGSFEDFDINMNSNLGEELANGFKKQLQAKLDEAKAQLRKMIDEKIGVERNKLKGEMDKSIGELTKNLDGKKAEVDKAIKEAKNHIEGEQKKGGTKKLEEEGKKLLKKFKLGG